MDCIIRRDVCLTRTPSAFFSTFDSDDDPDPPDDSVFHPTNPPSVPAFIWIAPLDSPHPQASPGSSRSSNGEPGSDGTPPSTTPRMPASLGTDRCLLVTFYLHASYYSCFYGCNACYQRFIPSFYWFVAPTCVPCRLRQQSFRCPCFGSPSPRLAFLCLVGSYCLSSSFD